MYQDDSFERMLKKKADEYRMYPSSQSWDKIQKKVQGKNNLFSFKSIGLTLVLISAFSLYLSKNQGAYTKVTQSPAPVALIQSERSFEATTTLLNHENNTNTSRLQTKPLLISDNNVLLSDDPSTTNEELIAGENAEPVLAEPLPADPSLADEPLFIQKASNESVLSAHKPDVSRTEPEQKLSFVHTQAQPEEALTEETDTYKTDAEINYEVKVPVIKKPKTGKQLQFYFTPSASYRVLYADNKITFGNLPQPNPENAATHTPAPGFEAGAALLFPVSKKVHFRTGLQLNYTHYTVIAFNAAPQLTTIRLNYSSIQRITTLNNNFGYFAKEIANETFQLSIPVGVEIQLAGKKKLQWDVAGNIQPTYLLTASGYLLTNDLKYYVKAPDLLSRINLNSSIETFIRWNTGKMILQAGPQLRYQLFSNARGEYPIREHLVDYGFRIGIVKPLR